MLIKGLGKDGAEVDKDTKRLYVHDLFSFVFKHVEKETNSKQIPVYLPSGSVPPIVLKIEEGK